MLEILFELGQVINFINLAVDAQPRETLRAQLVEQFNLLTFAPGNQGRHDHDARVGGQRKHMVNHLRHALRFKRLAVIGAVRAAHAREQQAQVIVNFRDGADCGTRVVAGGFLLDGNRR